MADPSQPIRVCLALVARISAILFVFALFLCAGAARTSAAEWNQWRGPQRDGVAADFDAPAPWPSQLRQSWSAEVGAGHSSPVVAGDSIFQFGRMGENEVLSCYDLRGELRWQREYAAPYEMNAAARGHGKGPKSTPVVAGGKVFTLGISGILTCRSADSGDEIWRRDFRDALPSTSPEFGAAMSPLVLDSACIAHVGGKGNGALVAFDVESGRQRWAWKGDGPAYTSPIVAELGGMKQLITQTQKHCLGLSASGEQLWTIDYETGYEQNIVTPVVFGDLVIFSGYQRGVTAYRVTRAGDGLAIAEAWHNDDVSMYMSSPVLVGESLYGFSERSRGQFFRLAPQTGEVVWKGPPRQGDNALLLAAGNVIMGLAVSGDLVVFRQQTDQYEEVARYQVADSPTWAHPALVNGRLVVKDADSLTMWAFGR